MRLHRIKLRNYRGVSESEVTFPERGVTVVVGDNEVGKTSLAEAVDLILECLDDSKKGRVRAVLPVDRDAGPEVEVEISTGPYRFVYFKRWLKNRETRLEILEPRRAQMTGREAHARVDAILEETLDKALWKALRLEQGTELAQAPVNVPSLGRALELAAGGEAVDFRGDDLWARVEAERARYWTAAGRPNADRDGRGKVLATARTAVQDAETRLRSLDKAVAEMESLDRSARELEEQQAAQEAAVRELTDQVRRVEELQREVERLDAERERTAALRDRSEGDSSRRQGLIEALSESERELGDRTRELDEAAPARAVAEKQAEDAKAAVDAARTALDEAQGARERADRDRDHRRREIELAQFTERRDRVVEAQEQWKAADATLESVRIDDGLLAETGEAHLELVRAEAAARSGAAVVEVTALQPLSLEIDGAIRQIDGGATETIDVIDEAEVVLTEHLRLRVRAGDAATDLAGRLRSAQDNYRNLCERGGVDGIEQAQSAAQDRRDAETQRAQAERTIRDNLRDLTLDALADKLARTAQQIEAYNADRPPEPPLPTDLDQATSVATEAERLVADRQEEARRREEAHARADEVLKGQAEAGAELVGRRNQAAGQLESTKAALEAARAEQSDEVIAGSLAQAQSDLAAAEEALEGAREALDAVDPDTTRTRYDNARDVLDRSRGDLAANTERRNELRIRLEVEGEQGLARLLDEAQSQVEHLEREHERVEARAAAARLLNETFGKHREATRQRYRAPFRERIEQLGRIVFGSSLEVELGEDLSIARRTLNGITVNFDQLSTGAKEQLAIISRLACAAIVAAEGGAPVILDDALGWTDPGRLERMGAAISVAGRTYQILILTCNPSRYAKVGSATVVRLPA